MVYWLQKTAFGPHKFITEMAYNTHQQQVGRLQQETICCSLCWCLPTPAQCFQHLQDYPCIQLLPVKFFLLQPFNHKFRGLVHITNSSILYSLHKNQFYGFQAKCTVHGLKKPSKLHFCKTSTRAQSWSLQLKLLGFYLLKSMFQFSVTRRFVIFCGSHLMSK